MAAAAFSGTVRAASGQWRENALGFCFRRRRDWRRTEWAGSLEVNRKRGSGEVVISSHRIPNFLRGCLYLAAQVIAKTPEPSHPRRPVWLGVSASLLVPSHSAFPGKQSRRTGERGRQKSLTSFSNSESEARTSYSRPLALKTLFL